MHFFFSLNDKEIKTGTCISQNEAYENSSCMFLMAKTWRHLRAGFI